MLEGMPETATRVSRADTTYRIVLRRNVFVLRVAHASQVKPFFLMNAAFSYHIVSNRQSRNTEIYDSI
jgi:hypothetical protein